MKINEICAIKYVTNGIKTVPISVGWFQSFNLNAVDLSIILLKQIYIVEFDWEKNMSSIDERCKFLCSLFSQSFLLILSFVIENLLLFCWDHMRRKISLSKMMCWFILWTFLNSNYVQIFQTPRGYTIQAILLQHLNLDGLLILLPI